MDPLVWSVRQVLCVFGFCIDRMAQVFLKVCVCTCVFENMCVGHGSYGTEVSALCELDTNHLHFYHRSKVPGLFLCGLMAQFFIGTLCELNN